MKTRTRKEILYYYYYISSDGKYVPETKDLQWRRAKGRLTTCDIFIGPDSLNNRQFPELAKGFEPSTSVVLRGWMKTAHGRRSGPGRKPFLLHYIIFIFYNYARLWFVY